jgi:hypothetical protein
MSFDAAVNRALQRPCLLQIRLLAPSLQPFDQVSEQRSERSAPRLGEVRRDAVLGSTLRFSP